MNSKTNWTELNRLDWPGTSRTGPNQSKPGQTVLNQTQPVQTGPTELDQIRPNKPNRTNSHNKQYSTRPIQLTENLRKIPTDKFKPFLNLLKKPFVKTLALEKTVTPTLVASDITLDQLSSQKILY